MRRVIGNKTVELSAAEFDELRQRHPGGLLLDAGTGDGKFALARAREQPDLLVVGLDANVDRCRRTASRAAAAPAKGGTPNLVLVHAPVERLPDGLTGITELTVLMPWGSLLRAVLEPSSEILTALAARCRADANLWITINLHAWRPPVPEVSGLPEPTMATEPDRLARPYAAAGWLITEVTDQPGAGTSWSRRLNAGRRRPAVLAIAGRLMSTG